MTRGKTASEDSFCPSAQASLGSPEERGIILPIRRNSSSNAGFNCSLTKRGESSPRNMTSHLATGIEFLRNRDDCSSRAFMNVRVSRVYTFRANNFLSLLHSVLLPYINTYKRGCNHFSRVIEKCPAISLVTAVRAPFVEHADLLRAMHLI